MTVSVRAATPSDIDSIVSLEGLLRNELASLRGGPVHLLRDHRPRPTLDSIALQIADPSTNVLIGAVNSVDAGFAVASLHILEGPYRLVDIEELFVESEFREVGLGAALMESILEWSEQNNADGIDSRAMPGDRGTKNFFESHGLVARSILVHKPLR